MSPGGGAAGQGDPYASGRWVRGLPAHHKRVAAATYWKLREAANSCRDYLSLHYRGDRKVQEWHDLWNIAQSIDITLEMEHKAGGYSRVCWSLDNDDRLEHWLSRIGAQIAYLRTGDPVMLSALQTGLAPGDADILPSWSIEAGRTEGKALYLQQGRIRGGRGGGQESDDGGGGARRPRRRPGRAGAVQPSGGGAAKAKAKAAPAAGT